MENFKSNNNSNETPLNKSKTDDTQSEPYKSLHLFKLAIDLTRFSSTSPHKAEENSTLIFPDLHGNALFLMQLFYNTGIIELPGKTAHFSCQDEIKDFLLKSLSNSLPDKNTLDLFKEILVACHLRTDVSIEFIGDTVADRGANDIYFLYLLFFFMKKGLSCSILLSNHDMELNEKFEHDENYRPLLQEQHRRSLINLEQLITNGIVSHKAVEELVVNYRSTLKAISYCLSSDGKAMTLLTHAGTDSRIIGAYLKKLQIAQPFKTNAEKASAIDAINKHVQIAIKANQLHSLYKRDECMSAYNYSMLNLREVNFNTSPFTFSLWNRIYDNLEDLEINKDECVNNGHGHDTKDPREHALTFDSSIGKSNHAPYLCGEVPIGYYSSKNFGEY